MADGIDTVGQEQAAPGDAPGLSETALARIAQAVGPLDDSTPERVGPYRLLREIGAGGMGVVYLAEQDEPLRRTVALKLIKPGMDSRDVIARFEQERRALALLNHRNVARVLDAGTTPGGRPYFVMEYVPGEPITRFCDERRLTIRQRLELFGQACEAVQHAHQKAIIHRDLKPSNILVAEEAGRPEVKVIDFGVAKALDAAAAAAGEGFTQVTQAGKPVGTPHYMSPEQACGADVDTRSDIYSLGVVLYELLTGALPFEPGPVRASSFDEIRRIIRDADPPRPSTRLGGLADRAVDVAARRGVRLDELQRELRGELEWIPLKATRADAAQRYPTASAFEQDIANYLAHRPLLAGPESTSYRLRKYVRRNRGAVIAASAVIAALLIGVVGTTVGLIHARAQRREAQTQSAIAGAVSRFQSDMLASADPNKMLGDKVTVLQAVTAAVAELDAGKLAGQPLVEAGVRTTIGQTLLSLGRYDAAEPNLRKALELRRGALGTDHPSVAESLYNLGVLFRDQGKWIEPEAPFVEALRIRRRVLSARDPQIAQSLESVGWVYWNQGRIADADPLIRDAVERFRDASPANPAAYAMTLSLHGSVLRSKGKLAEAEEACREAASVGSAALPARHPDLARIKSRLAYVLEMQGRGADAEQLHREAVLAFRSTLPAGHPDICRALNRLGHAVCQQGRPVEAEAIFREALEIAQRAYPADHPNLGVAWNSLALSLQDQGRFTEAEPLFRQSLDHLRRTLAPANADVGVALCTLADLLRDQSRFDEAEPLLREALAIFRNVFPADHPRIASTLENLRCLQPRDAKSAGAEPELAGRADTSQSTRRP